GPLDADVATHLNHLASFNSRQENPTAWEVDLRAGPNWLERFLREQPGNTVVLSGRNRQKIDLMRAAVGQALNVLADKPWIVEPADFPKLDELFRAAELHEVLVWDVMTERHEVTNRLQRELVRDPDIFGGWQSGSPAQPALVLESVHHLKKLVAGRPLVRPWWWFDPLISGEAMADVGTHLADLALWLIAPDHPIDYLADIAILDAESWPLVLSGEQFRELTGLANYPAELATQVVSGQLYYAGNGTVLFKLGDIHVKLGTQWEYEAPPRGGDTHAAIALGTKARVSIRQQPDGDPEVWVTPNDPADHARMMRQLYVKCDDLREQLPGLSLTDRGTEVQFRIPDELRIGHEGHFALVMEEFTRYFQTPRAVPAWERPNTLAKYYITTRAVELAREKRAK
ncbi:MAG TPA: putative oxidoreductase C-terminal domain-containing protein, partial [Gemmata sp.]|nr:putative oxidoreductase C-terminal domain-containing protein [Gemmata sp.]